MRGYYRYPTVHEDRVVFVSEDDLWEVPLGGGLARRLTSGLGEASSPAFSPDGSTLAFTATEEGAQEVYLMSSRGGAIRRLTFDGAAHVIGWDEAGQHILYASDRQSPHRRLMRVFSVPAVGGQPEDAGVGEGVWLSEQPGGPGRVLGRHRTDLARWKRYKGGLAGALWVDTTGEDDWVRLFADRPAGYCCPMWIGARVWFLSDVDGHGNLYSCLPDGGDLTQHTHHRGFFARHCRTDGEAIVYARGGELWHLDIASGESRRIEVEYHSPRTQLNRKFVDAQEYLEDFALHPKGHSLAVTARGKAYNFGLWEGAVRQTGAEQGARYRLMRYLDEESGELVVVSDEGGEERLERHAADGTYVEVVELEGADLGRAVEMVPSPGGDVVAVSNHRHELVIADLETGEARVIARSEHDRIQGMAWSADGRWLAYSLPTTSHLAQIMLLDTRSGEVHPVTRGEFKDTDPAFDPDGRFLYFISYRHFDPVYGNLFFELSLNRGQRPCLVTLREDVESPFVATPRPLSESDGDDEDDGEASEEKDGEEAHEEAKRGEDDALEIDLEGIAERVIAFPVPEGRYHQIAATSSRVFYTVSAPSGALGGDDDEEEAGTLRYWSLSKRKNKTFHDDVLAFELGADGKTLALWTEDDSLRVVDATGSPPEDDDDDKTTRETGWVDLERVSIEVDPRAEWRQMLREIWRLMRDHFWREDMSGVDWEAVWARYSPLTDRVGSRSEFSDLVWAMQGELGTSHAYEFGGDYREPPRYSVGHLGVDVVWDPKWRSREVDEPGCYRIAHIARGDDWDPRRGSPLARPGLGVAEGDALLAVNGKRLSRHHSLQQRLVNEAGKEVELLVHSKRDDAIHTVTVRALGSERHLRYREWVRTRRELVHQESEGRVGYIHIPDMGAHGYAEFHRSFSAELHRDALVIDVRFNGGGHVSPLILEKLGRAPLGFDLPRHGAPIPYPYEGPRGPIVALTNEYAGSDGDIFSHCFKLLGFGPLLGQRTWGGVIGIWPRHTLVDGSVTTQPEFSFWFVDVGFGVENHGTEPDIEVPLPPDADAEDEDVQLEAAVDKALELLKGTHVGPPDDFGPFPDLSVD